MYHQHQTPMPFHSLSFFFFFFFSINLSFSSIRAELDSLNQRSSLSVESSEDVVVSPDGSFSAGFRSVGDNAFCFAVWFTKSSEFTPVWMANRDRPVNGKRSTLSLQKDGNLVLRDAGQSAIWTTNTASTLPVQLRLSTEGNLMLQTLENTTLWQSFDFPTNTLLPEQLFTRNTKLISSRSRSNYSSGFYSFYFDNDNLLRLLYNGPNVSSVYWPDPGFVSWDNGRNADNSSRFAMLDLLGFFQSTDEFTFYASDYGIGPKRRLTMDFDGNLRLYSLDGKSGNWRISWQAMSNVCQIHGLCGPNGVCVYEPEARCTCPHGFKPKDPTDWSQGCEPTFSLSCDPLDSTFVTLLHMDFYGNDFNYTTNITIQQCRNICLELCSCKAFVYKIESLVKEGSGRCYPKTALFSGYRAVSYDGWMNIKVPRNWAQDKSHDLVQELNSTKINCNPDSHMELATRFERKKENVFLRHLLWFVTALGGVELICLVTGWWYTYKNKGPSSVEQGYITSATGYKRYSYAELKRATRNFSAEIGRGGSGVVYRGKLVDNRVVAVKRLEGVHQGEAEFLAEVSMIGRINHMNLIKMWGLCADKCHDWEQRLLVFEYMENGSLAENLSSNALDWGKRFGIAVGTAKGLAYLHEECLEWVLHCDVKPQNILLDANYLPKVADFGLSKLRDRGSSVDNSSFSTVRGTRGYMAPEWILNLPITSKVDVYSYGIVVLEMVTGKLSIGFSMVDESRGREYGSLVIWVREMMNATADGIEEIMDPRVDDKYDEVKMRLLVKVALQCVEEDKDARPTMSQVVEMLLRHEHKH